MNDILRALRRNRRAAAVLEFAVASNLFLMFVFGTVNLCGFAMMMQDLDRMVHAAGRYAVIHGAGSPTPATAASLTSLIRNGTIIPNPANISVTVDFTPDNKQGGTVNIQASYPALPFTPMFGGLFTGTISATSVSTILK